MVVNSSNSIEYQRYLQRIAAQQAAAQSSAETSASQTAAASFFSQGTDSFAASSETDSSDLVIPSEQYNDMKPTMNTMRPPMPPAAPPEDSTAESASETEAVSDDTDDTDSSILSSISSTMRVNQDSIEAAMKKLGLTDDDLTDEDSLTKLLDELTQGAKDRGLQTASETAVESLIAKLTEGSSSTSETAAGTTVEEA